MAAPAIKVAVVATPAKAAAPPAPVAAAPVPAPVLSPTTTQKKWFFRIENNYLSIQIWN